MCHHFRFAEDARIAQARDVEAETGRERTARRTTEDSDAPADPDDYVDIDEVAERVDDGGAAVEGEAPGGAETEPEPVGFA